MRVLFLIAFLASVQFSLAQKQAEKIKRDTLIRFFQIEGVQLSGRESRVIPNDSKSPFYVSINYDGTQKLNYEYFRADSSSYLFYEYFSNTGAGYYDGIKSSGIKVLKRNPHCDTILVDAFDPKTGDKISTYFLTQYYTELLKEGAWLEYEDSTRNPVYWKGNYKNNIKTGVWRRMIRDLDRELVIEQIDFSKDSSKKISPENIASLITLDSLKKALVGAKWLLRINEQFDKGSHAAYYRCTTPYGDLCNEQQNYYSFALSNDFARSNGIYGASNYPNLIGGKWELTKAGGQWLIKITFSNSETWKFKILYLDKDYRLITERI